MVRDALRRAALLTMRPGGFRASDTVVLRWSRHILQRSLKPAERYAFLFQPDPVPVSIACKRFEQYALARRELRKVAAKRLFLLDPQRAMRQKRVVVHEQGTSLGEAAAQPVEHRKAMGVDVAPVMNF